MIQWKKYIAKVSMNIRQLCNQQEFSKRMEQWYTLKYTYMLPAHSKTI